MKNKTRNYIIAGVVAVLGLITCAIAVGMGGQGQMINEDMWDSQGGIDNNPVSGETIEFKTKDLEGKEVNSSIFKDYKITILNLWSTSCSPCIEEMPAIQKLQDEYRDEIKVIGVLEEYEKKDAPDILRKQKIAYTNVVADEGLQKITSQFMYIPVTLFVDSDGTVLDTFIPGSTDYETLEAMVNELLEK